MDNIDNNMDNNGDNVSIHKMNNDLILVELIKKQRKNIPADKKLLHNDLKRISKYLTASIFGNECSIWNGYVTVIKNDEKNSYVNFYYCGKKYALHRLLYHNFIGELSDFEYIKFKCPNKGKCCNINHFYKINKDNDTQIEKQQKEQTNQTNQIESVNSNLKLNTNTKNSLVNCETKTNKNIVVNFNL